MASLVIYISSYPARPRRITVNYNITNNNNSNNNSNNKNYTYKLSPYVAPSSSLYFCDKCGREKAEGEAPINLIQTAQCHL